MRRNTPPTQQSHSRAQNQRSARPLNNQGATGQYNSTFATQSTTHNSRSSTLSTESSSPLHADSIAHDQSLWNVVRAPLASSSSATVPNRPIILSESWSSPTPVANDAQEWTWPSTSNDQYAPPPHTRSLYATIELPEVGAHDQWDVHRYGITTTGSRNRGLSSPLSSSTSTPLANPNPLHSPPTWARRPPFPHDTRSIQLHPILHSAYLSSRQSQSTTPRSGLGSPTRTVDWARNPCAPATNPGVGYLTLFIHATGETIIVRPSSLGNPHVVTVNDVLDALGYIFMITDRPCRSHCPTSMQTGSCGCERISAIVNSLELWWRVDENALAGRRPWQLVVGPR